jgi:hypothetical protein
MCHFEQWCYIIKQLAEFKVPWFWARAVIKEKGRKRPSFPLILAADKY